MTAQKSNAKGKVREWWVTEEFPGFHASCEQGKGAFKVVDAKAFDACVQALRKITTGKDGFGFPTASAELARQTLRDLGLGEE